jgi:sister-chromatid-cohesion protein PDS5
LCIIQLSILLLFLSHDSLVSSLEIYGFFYYQDDVPQVRKLFLSKVHQYIKERALDAKYACAFLLAMDDYHAPQYEEFKHNIIEVAQICQQVKMRQLSVQAETNVLTAYPEYMISYLVHALSHDPSCPNIEEHEDVEAFGPIYWYLIMAQSFFF